MWSTMFCATRSTLRLAALLLLVLLELGGSGHARRRHRRRHPADPDLPTCPDDCLCRPVGQVPCDWCAETAVGADTLDDRVSCEGCNNLTEHEVYDDIT